MPTYDLQHPRHTGASFIGSVCAVTMTDGPVLDMRQGFLGLSRRNMCQSEGRYTLPPQKLKSLKPREKCSPPIWGLGPFDLTEHSPNISPASPNVLLCLKGRYGFTRNKY